MKHIPIRTTAVQEFVDITSILREEVRQAGFDEGSCLVFCPHTTAGLTVNEHADPSVAADMLDALERMVPDRADWQHAEGNSPAHVKASLVGASARLAIESGDLVLGTWQGVFFCEFDGPRAREIWLRLEA